MIRRVFRVLLLALALGTHRRCPNRRSAVSPQSTHSGNIPASIICRTCSSAASSRPKERECSFAPISTKSAWSSTRASAREGRRRRPRRVPRRRPSRAGRSSSRKLCRRPRCRQVATARGRADPPRQRNVGDAARLWRVGQIARHRTVAIRWPDGHRNRQLPRAEPVTAICRARQARAGTTSCFAARKVRVWVTDFRPRGQGFELDVNRRVDTDRWVEVTGTVVREKGLVSLKATRMSLTKAPQVNGRPTNPSVPARGVATRRGRLQFADRRRDRRQRSGSHPHSVLARTERELARGEHPGELSWGSRRRRRIQVGLRRGQSRHSDHVSPSLFRRFEPSEIELLDGIKGFDGAPFKPWTVTFSVGG